MSLNNSIEVLSTEEIAMAFLEGLVSFIWILAIAIVSWLSLCWIIYLLDKRKKN